MKICFFFLVRTSGNVSNSCQVDVPKASETIREFTALKKEFGELTETVEEFKSEYTKAVTDIVNVLENVNESVDKWKQLDVEQYKKPQTVPETEKDKSA